MGEWTENKYTETRFGGVDAAHEPHTLDRDGGLMASIFNMLTRTQGLATRHGYRVIYDLQLNYTPAPGTPKPATGLIPYEDNLSIVPEDDEGGEVEPGGTVYPSSIIPDAGSSSHSSNPKPPKEKEEEEEQEQAADELPVVPGRFSVTCQQVVICDVPFQLSVSRLGLPKDMVYNGGGSSLQVAMKRGSSYAKTTSYKLSPKINASWANSRWTGAMCVMVRDRSYSGVRFTVRRGDADTAMCEATYVVGGMYPYMPEIVYQGVEFTYSIKFEYLTVVMEGYAGEGAGVIRAFHGLDNNRREVGMGRGSVKVVGVPRWDKGVLTGKAVITGKLPSEVAILRLQVQYAGEIWSADAAIVRQATIIECPARLHVWGDSELLMMSVNN